MPNTSLSIAVITFLIFLLELLHPDGLSGAQATWGMNPELAFGGGTLPGTALPAWLGVFTATFIHVGWTHLGANMLILLVLGSEVEQVLGRWMFAALYLLGGWTATLAESLVHASSNRPLVGASLAVGAVLGAWLVVTRAGTRTRFGAAAGTRWGRGAAVVVSLIQLGTAMAALLGWFGYALLAALTGAGLRIFWSRGFSAHVSGVACGLVLLATMAAVCRAMKLERSHTQ